MINTSKFVETLNGKPVAVFGLGISNIAAIKALSKSGADIVAWDDNAARRENLDVPVRDLMQEDLSRYACLILAPGIMPDHALVQKAQAAGLETMCDLEILHRCGHGLKTIGITGTNGKSTTTALIGHILNECGVAAAVGGNIGTAALALDIESIKNAPATSQNTSNVASLRKQGSKKNAHLPDPCLRRDADKKEREAAHPKVIVLEVSSYQADLCPTFAPDIAVHLNLTPDHIDHHGTMENYKNAKMKLFRGKGQAVIAVDDEISKDMLAEIKKKNERECFAVSFTDEEVASLDLPALRGDHNKQNVAAAIAVAELMGLEPDEIIAAVKTFPGLPHRQYLTNTIRSVSYTNDSKATNADATSKALTCYDDIYWIVGGVAKEGGLNGLEPYMGKVKHAFLIGEAMDEFALWLDKNNVGYTKCGTLDKAVKVAAEMAQKGSTVLLSPACASFDQFKSFEARGDAFTKLVNELETIS